MLARPSYNVDGARHLLRALLRECTYLPDQAARVSIHRHVILRFRKYHPEKEKDPQRKRSPEELLQLDAALTPERLRGAFRNARKGLNLLRRANHGEAKPLQQVLMCTYGRIGKQRHEFMRPLLLPDDTTDSQKVEGWLAKMDAAENPSRALAYMPKAVQAQERQPGKPQTYTISKNYSRLRALLASQIQTRTFRPRVTRLRSLNLEIPLTNIWARPFPKRREKNMVINWYASVLDKVLPPLPEEEWERLRDLVTGACKWEGLKPRRTRPTSAPYHLDNYDFANLAYTNGPEGDHFLTLACRSAGLPEDGSVEEKLSRLAKASRSHFTPGDRWLSRGTSDPAILETVLQDGLDIKRFHKTLPGIDQPQNITARLMRRFWARIFAQCPVMRLNDKMQWTVEWGSWNYVRPPMKTTLQDASLFEGADSRGNATPNIPEKIAAHVTKGGLAAESQVSP